MKIAAVLLLTLLPSCTGLATAGKDVVTHTRQESQELIDHSLGKFDKLLDEKLEKLDKSIEKAAKHIGTAVKEVVDADVIAFAAVGVVGLGTLAVLGWFILSWLRIKADKNAKGLEQNN